MDCFLEFMAQLPLHGCNKITSKKGGISKDGRIYLVNVLGYDSVNVFFFQRFQILILK